MAYEPANYKKESYNGLYFFVKFLYFFCKMFGFFCEIFALFSHNFCSISRKFRNSYYAKQIETKFRVTIFAGNPNVELTTLERILNFLISQKTLTMIFHVSH